MRNIWWALCAALSACGGTSVAGPVGTGEDPETGGGGSTASAGNSSGGSTQITPPPPVGGGGSTQDPPSGEAGAAGADGVDIGIGEGDLTLLVVFDKSGSMASGWDERTKWQVANEALMKAIEGVLDNLTLAAVFFPQPGECNVTELGSDTQVDFMPGRAFASYWLETAGSRVPDGATPLELAFHVADRAIQNAEELGLLDDRFRVVLVTDGEPTCNDDGSVVTSLAAAWHEKGVQTWVMGLPGSATAHQLLDAIALAGGTEKHQSLGEPSALDRGLYDAAR